MSEILENYFAQIKQRKKLIEKTEKKPFLKH